MLRYLAMALALVGSTAQAQSLTGPRYVSMGSSYAAGPGIAPFEEGAPARCARSIRNYAHQLAGRRGLKLVDVSCSGATTANILAPWGEQPAQIEAVTRDTRLVTITIGGNDIGYIRGLGPSPCLARPDLKCPSNVATEEDYVALKAAMTRIVAETRKRAPKAVIALVQYPVILPPAGVCAALPLSEETASAARVKAERLARITAEVARQAGVTLIETDSFSRGHDACAAEPWMNGYPAPGAAPFHPNLAAMSAIADALDKVLPR